MAFAERPASNKILVSPQLANMQLPDDPDESEQVDIVDICAISAIMILTKRENFEEIFPLEPLSNLFANCVFYIFIE